MKNSPELHGKAGSLGIEYIRGFCSGDIDGLHALLHPHLVFEGPWLQCRSRETYLAALKADPPEPANFQILAMHERTNDAAITWKYQKRDATMLIELMITVDEKSIISIYLKFKEDDS